jgi:hypothetical protein
MSVRVISKFSAHVVPPTDLAAGDGLLDYEVHAEEAFAVPSDRPASVAIDSLGCFRGIFWAVAFEAGMLFAGFAAWEAWRLIR